MTNPFPTRYSLQLSDAELRALGAAIAQWANLETLIAENSIWWAEHIGVTPPRGWDGIAFRGRFDAFKVVLTHPAVPEQHRQAAIDIACRIEPLIKTRHFLAHGATYRNPSDPREILILKERPARPVVEHVTNADDLTRFEVKVSEINGALAELVFAWSRPLS